VLEHTVDLVDHISLHAYYEEKPGDLGSFLASGVGLDRFIGDVAQIIDEVTVAAGLDKQIGISVDEWNVWYQTRFNEVDKEPLFTGDWNTQPRLIEDEYNVSDAVVVGSLLISLLRNSDRVSMANLAQLVNVIAPIRSEPNGPAWRQTTFFPFALTAAAARGEVLAATIHSDSYDTAAHGTVDLVDAAVTATDEEIVLFLVNRSSDDALTLEVDLAGAPAASVLSAQSLFAPEGGDRFATNAVDHQDTVHPVDLTEVTLAADGTAATVVLPALSWSIVRLAARSAA